MNFSDENPEFTNETVKMRDQDGKLIDSEYLMFMPVMGHYLDAIFASEDTLRKRNNMFKEDYIQAFNPPKFTAGQHRALYGVFKLYQKKGFTLHHITKGIYLTPYELCEAMEYRRNKDGKFHIADQKEAIGNVISVGKTLVDIYHRRFIEVNKNKKRLFEVTVYKDVKMLECEYRAIVSEEEKMLLDPELRGKARLLKVKLHESLFNPQYFKLSVTSFYSELREVLNKDNKRMSEYHWIFMLWLLKQNKQKMEINIDKLVKIFNIPTDNKHLPRARKKVRELYSIFKDIEYLLDYEIDVKAKNGNTKDILTINPEKFRSLQKRLKKVSEKALGFSKN